ncbi:hypothetical protein J2X36_004537 [Methylobacterium sp. BE186]|uniref:hypothetical protein n=1 Tax=Methylobacterium sp. BE186 TaxID=2817715 RepID=UPI00286550F4|nr:hypothetical protein [Methylobacterium sp. BE186]MDR7039759.1 hypothetical protein [Methylobacterium sp. BE186]
MMKEILPRTTRLLAADDISTLLGSVCFDEAVALRAPEQCGSRLQHSNSTLQPVRAHVLRLLLRSAAELRAEGVPFD